MATLFIPVKFRTNVQLAPDAMDADFEDKILSKLRDTYEGVCSRFGYVKTGSISIYRRSLGLLMKPHFNGYIRFDVLVRALVCNPVPHMILPAVVKNKNQLGLLAECWVSEEEQTPVLDVIVPRRSAGIASEIDIDEVAIGDRINIEVLGKRYQLKDRKISIIGRAVKPAAELTLAVDPATGAVLDVPDGIDAVEVEGGAEAVDGGDVAEFIDDDTVEGGDGLREAEEEEEEGSEGGDSSSRFMLLHLCI